MLLKFISPLALDAFKVFVDKLFIVISPLLVVIFNVTFDDKYDGILTMISALLGISTVGENVILLLLFTKFSSAFDEEKLLIFIFNILLLLLITSMF